MSDTNRYNENDYFDDYGDNYGSDTRRKIHSDSDEDYPITAKYAAYFNNYGDGTDNDAESNEIYSHSSHYSETRQRPNKTHETKKKKHFFRRFLVFLLILLLIAGGGFSFLVYTILDCVNYVEIDTSDDYMSDLQGDTATQLIRDKRVQNILLFGVDDDSSDYGRSDTMLLLSIDSLHRKIKMTSFQRDTFVYVPDPDGAYHTKLTNAFSYGGVPLAVNTIEANYGIQIDHYATVNFKTFKAIVDILGGVEVELTDREILYINCQIAQNNQTEYLDAEEGLVTLNGQQALWYARNRGGDVINGVEFYEGTDWDRTERQRKFLSAVIDDMKTAGIKEIISIVNEAGPYITTNLTKPELMALVFKSLFYLRYDIEQNSMPTDGNWSYEDNFAGNVIYVNDWESVRYDLARFIYED